MSSDETYVCHPCKQLHPDTPGEIVVPTGTNGAVWCPWCGDKMENLDQ